MGMDLVPRRQGCNGFHANWTGWRYLAVLLEVLGCDISKMDSCNDGHYVDTKIARSWGKAVLAAIDKIRDKPIPSMLGSNEYTPFIAETPEEIAELAFDGAQPLDEDTRKWLIDFGIFCLNSGGFRQC